MSKEPTTAIPAEPAKTVNVAQANIVESKAQPSPQPKNLGGPDDLIDPFEEELLDGISDEIPETVPNPLTSETVIEREYVKPQGATPAGQPEPVIPEPSYAFTPPPPITPTDPIGPAAEQPNGGSAQKPKVEKPPVNPNYDALSARQKREGAERLADAALLAYGNLFPMPFKWLASFNMKKLRKLELQNKLSLKMRVMDDGTTLKQYAEGHNTMVEGTFVITEGMKQDIREPLIEVLMEKGVAATPTERLLYAVAGHAIQFGIASVGLHRETVAALKQIQSLYLEQKLANASSGATNTVAEPAKPQDPISPSPVNNTPPVTPSVTPSNTPSSNEPPVPAKRKAGRPKKVVPETVDPNRISLEETINAPAPTVEAPPLENGQGGITIEEL